MSIKGDVIAIGVAGVVVLAAGWYAKKKIAGVASDVKDNVVGAINWAGQPIDGVINAAGQFITGDAGWTSAGGHTPQYGHQFDDNFGIIDLSGW